MSRRDSMPAFRGPRPPAAEAQVDRGGGESFSLVYQDLVARLDGGQRRRRATRALRVALDDQQSSTLRLVTDLTRTRAALFDQMEERTRLERIIASALDAIVTVDADNRIVLFNVAAERIFQCSAQEATGLKADRFIPLQALAPERTPPDGARPVAGASSERTVCSYPSLQAVRRDGSSFPAEIAISEVDAPGESLRTIIVRDVTLRRSAEEALCRLSSAVEQTGDGICITDSHGIIEYVNPAFERLMGFTRREMIGHRPTKFSSGRHEPGFYEGLWDTVLAGEVFRRVFIDRKADGEAIHLDETITPLTDADGRITHFVAIARDVTPRIRTEEALRRVNEHLEGQAEAIAQSLHDEAGQLLTSAHIALVEAGRDLPQPVRDRLHEVRRHLDGIEEQLRRVAHELRPPILDDRGLVPALAFLVEGVERRWGIAVVVEAELAERLPHHVESAVYRLVQEALTNVTKHAKARRATIRLDRRPGTLRCAIEDDGVGFDASAVGQGAARPGMGLRGVRDRVEALGGTLDIRSAPGQGSTLAITIPLGT